MKENPRQIQDLTQNMFIFKDEHEFCGFSELLIQLTTGVAVSRSLDHQLQSSFFSGSCFGSRSDNCLFIIQK